MQSLKPVVEQRSVVAYTNSFAQVNNAIGVNPKQVFFIGYMMETGHCDPIADRSFATVRICDNMCGLKQLRYRQTRKRAPEPVRPEHSLTKRALMKAALPLSQ